MSKNRKEWYELVIGFAVLFTMVAVVSFVTRLYRHMDTSISWFWMILSGVLFFVALLIHEGKDVLALPQALWMAIQDKRRILNVNESKNSDSVCVYDD